MSTQVLLEPAETAGLAPVKQRFSLKEWIFTTDHKRVAVLYMIGAFAAFSVAGIMAMLMRTELASLGPTITENPTSYNTWLYLHGAARTLGSPDPGVPGLFPLPRAPHGFFVDRGRGQLPHDHHLHEGSGRDLGQDEHVYLVHPCRL